jgi:hypothetical protein
MLPSNGSLHKKWGIVSEHNRLIPNNSAWNREFAKPFSVENSGGQFDLLSLEKFL